MADTTGEVDAPLGYAAGGQAGASRGVPHLVELARYEATRGSGWGSRVRDSMVPLAHARLSFPVSVGFLHSPGCRNASGRVGETGCGRDSCALGAYYENV